MGWVKDLVTVTKHVGDATCRIWGGEEEPVVVGILSMERSLGNLTRASDGDDAFCQVLACSSSQPHYFVIESLDLSFLILQ